MKHGCVVENLTEKCEHAADLSKEVSLEITKMDMLDVCSVSAQDSAALKADENLQFDESEGFMRVMCVKSEDQTLKNC